MAIILVAVIREQQRGEGEQLTLGDVHSVWNELSNMKRVPVEVVNIIYFVLFCNSIEKDIFLYDA